MSTFTSGGGSSSSGTHGDPVLDPEEVGKRLELDAKVVDWLRNEPPNDEAVILVLNYQNEFLNTGDSEVNKLTVSNALIGLGATLISDNVFKFDNWETMYSAKDSMWSSMPWCFFFPHLATAQKLNISQQPTIKTNVITWLPENTANLTIIPYHFFSM